MSEIKNEFIKFEKENYDTNSKISLFFDYNFQPLQHNKNLMNNNIIYLSQEEINNLFLNFKINILNNLN
jgi:hypothetical protein